MAKHTIAMEVNLRKNENQQNAGYGKYYFEVARKPTLSLKGFAQHMVDHGSIYSRDVIEGVLKKITQCLPELLSQGVPVQLEPLGTFYPTAKNVFNAALCEAAFMTGLERNADVVHMATYAPLFAHVDGWQWRPDLIWMDNLTTVRTPNYYVQQMYATNSGTHVLNIEMKNQEQLPAPRTANDIYYSAVMDKTAGDYVVKMVNTGNLSQEWDIEIKGVKNITSLEITSLHADRMDAANTIENKTAVVPTTSKLEGKGNVWHVEIPAKTFRVFRFKTK